MTKTFKMIGVILGVLIATVWFVGALVMFVYYEYDRRSACIQNEGLLKGLLWCETDYKTQAERGFGHIALTFKNLSWPLNLISSTNKVPETKVADEKLKKYESVLKECGYDPKAISSIARDCVIRRTNQLAGKDTYRQAHCQREANAYENFAQVRDSGATLNNALQEIDKAFPDIVQKLSNASGKQLNEKQLIEETKQIIKYVYAHPDKTPSLISLEHYAGCLNK